MGLNEVKEKLKFFEEKGKTIGFNVEDYYDIKRILDLVIEKYDNVNGKLFI